MLRSAHTGNEEEIIFTATDLLADTNSRWNLNEAHYYVQKLICMCKTDGAMEDLKIFGKDTRNAARAEAKYKVVRFN